MMPIALLVLSVFLETFSTFPFVLILIVFLSILLKKNEVIFFAFLGGLLLDTFLLRTLGLTSFFMLVFAFLTISYQNKFEADTLIFVSIFSFAGSFLYLLFTNAQNPLPVSISAAFFSATIYIIFKRRSHRKDKRW